MVPAALIVGVLAGMREGSKSDRTLSTFIDYHHGDTGICLRCGVYRGVFKFGCGLKWFKGSAASAMDEVTFANFTLPVMTMALYGMGYIARMTRASMAEVMTPNIYVPRV